MGAAADRSIVMAVRRELIRRQSIDSSAVNVHSINGVVEVSGTLRLTSFAETDLEDEWKKIREIVMRVHGVRDVIDRYLRRF